MKTIILSTVLAGFLGGSAQAQSSVNSQFAKNYPICLVGNTYQVCAPGQTSDLSGGEAEFVTFGIESTHVHMGYADGNARYQNQIRVTYDDPAAPYHGKPSMTNDGVETNIHRNINYLNSGVSLPPSDGGIY